ncbi:MAG TPA: Gfo/Idh/MocA family oxidoreductase, partial [Micromonosporaceae bacterium]|nr:Gfo/Idh/MocA family oxidoreductase [Micromonosporaceae bacterium]
MRGALIGLGTIGRGHLAGYAKQDQLEVVAFVDPIGPRALADHQAWRNTPCFDSLSELLESQSLDFIDICTPPNTHLDYIQTGLRHGLHVLCEKPVIHSDDDFRDLRETVSKATSVLFPAHNYLFAPGITRIREVVRHPDFGEIQEINFQTLRSRSALGTADWIPHWRRQLSISGGGILRDHGPHSFYVMRHITGLTPQDVSCLVGNTGAVPPVCVPAGTEGEPAVEDTAVIRVRFHNGIEGRLDLTWAANRRETVYQVRGSRQTVTMIDDEITVTGES